MHTSFVYSCCTAVAPVSRLPLPLKQHSTPCSTWRSPRLHCRRQLSYTVANDTRRFFSAKRNVYFSLRPSTSTSPWPDEVERTIFNQVAKRLYCTSRYFKQLGGLVFWGQLLCSSAATAILSFLIFSNPKVSSPAIFYATAGGIAAAFISIFWSFGYMRLADKLQTSVNTPAKAPSRADVVKSLKNCIILNMLGMGACIFGLLAKIGALAATMALASSGFLRGISSSTHHNLSFAFGCLLGPGVGVDDSLPFPQPPLLSGVAARRD